MTIIIIKLTFFSFRFGVSKSLVGTLNVSMTIKLLKNTKFYSVS